MKEAPGAPADETELHAYVDGRLDAAGRAALEARLAVDPQLAATVAAWERQKAALQALHRDALHDDIPAPLLQAATQLDRRSARVARWQLWGGVAASILLAFALGWAGHGEWLRLRDASAAAAARP